MFVAMRLRALRHFFIASIVACSDDATPSAVPHDAGVRPDATVDGGRVDASAVDASAVDAARDGTMDAGPVADASDRASGLTCGVERALVSVDGAPPRSYELPNFSMVLHDATLVEGRGWGLDARALLGYWAPPVPERMYSGEVGGSLLMLDATREGPGEILCSGPSSGWVTETPPAQVDLVLHSVASLGRCPGGKPVAGSITVCTSLGCDLSGTLDGKQVASKVARILGNEHINAMAFTAAEGRAPDVATMVYPEYYEDDPEDRYPWTVLLMSAASAYPGELLCVGKVESAQVEYYRKMTLSNFTRLGACPTNGTRSVRACARRSSF